MITPITHIYIIHYHFKKGGVSDVVLKALSALDNAIIEFPKLKKITLVCGSQENINSFLDINLQRVSIHSIIDSSIGYSDTKNKKRQHHIQNIFKKITLKNSLWWVHNHNLGKNVLFTKILMEYLQKTNHFALLQLHDFPESARYANLKKLRNIMPHYKSYMGGMHTLLAVINKEDASMLKKANYFPAYIPNIIHINKKIKKNKNSSRNIKKALLKQKNYSLKNNYMLFTYPVRCIRRKNVLEAALISTMYSHHSNIPCMLALTLPGISKQEQSYSKVVKQLFKKETILGFFDTESQNTRFSFVDICRASDMIISSSTQEGFGFTYINTTLWEVPLLARNIPVKKDNIKVLKPWIMHWYRTIHVPLSLFKKSMIHKMKQAYTKKIHAQSHLFNSQTKHYLLTSVDNLFHGNTIDFSFLSIDMQIMIITICKKDSNILSSITYKNKNLMNKIDTLLHNTDIISPDITQAIHNNIEKYHSEKSFIKHFKKAVNTLYKNNIPLSSSIAKNCASHAITHFAQLSYFRLLYNPYNYTNT